MTRFIAQRIMLAVVSVWGVLTVVFFMSKLIPGDAARVAAGRTASAAQIEQARATLGLDRPVLEQYANFLWKAVHGDLGMSASTHQAIVSDLGATLPVTVQLVVVSMIITVLVAIPLGVVAAVTEGHSPDVAARIFFVLAGGVPVFWLAIILQWILAARIGLFPISGSNSFGMAPPNVTGFTMLDSILAGSAPAFFDSLGHVILPAIALSAPFLAAVARNVRSTMIGVLQTDYISFAVSKGASPARVVLRHGLRSSIGSTLTIIGMQFGWMMGAALLVESIFALPGIGVYLNAAVLNQDTFAVLGCVLVIGVVFTAASFIVDAAHIALDPRARASHLDGAS